MIRNVIRATVLLLATVINVPVVHAHHVDWYQSAIDVFHFLQRLSADAYYDPAQALEQGKHEVKCMLQKQATASCSTSSVEQAIHNILRVHARDPYRILLPFGELNECRVAVSPYRISEQKYILVIKLGSICSTTSEKILDQLDKLGVQRDKDMYMGAVLDLTNNYGGLVFEGYAVAGEFMAERVLLGTITEKSGRVTEYWSRGGSTILTELPVMAMFNERTNSTAELILSSLLSNGRLQATIGQKGIRTCGKAHTVTAHAIHDAGIAMFSSGILHDAEGQTYQDKGFCPTIAMDTSDPDMMREQAMRLFQTYATQ